MKLCLICWRSINGNEWTVNGHGPFCGRLCLDRFVEAAEILALPSDEHGLLADMLADRPAYRKGTDH